jgi:hypothetical protein
MDFVKTCVATLRFENVRTHITKSDSAIRRSSKFDWPPLITQRFARSIARRISYKTRNNFGVVQLTGKAAAKGGDGVRTDFGYRPTSDVRLE